MTALPNRIAATLALPTFWAGAAKVRDPDDPAIERCHKIEAGLIAGKPLGDIAAFAEWLRARAGR